MRRHLPAARYTGLLALGSLALRATACAELPSPAPGSGQTALVDVSARAPERQATPATTAQPIAAAPPPEGAKPPQPANDEMTEHGVLGLLKTDPTPPSWDGPELDRAFEGAVSREKAPQVKAGAAGVSGRLPPEVIQRIVRANFDRFRTCYEHGLLKNPNLKGRVAVRFVIGRDGAVTSAVKDSSDLPDQGVVSCIVDAVAKIAFPKPEGGTVTVVYPISFLPGDPSAAKKPASSPSTQPNTPSPKVAPSSP
jgi:hypothetical protein